MELRLIAESNFQNSERFRRAITEFFDLRPPLAPIPSSVLADTGSIAASLWLSPEPSSTLDAYVASSMSQLKTSAGESKNLDSTCSAVCGQDGGQFPNVLAN